MRKITALFLTFLMLAPGAFAIEPQGGYNIMNFGILSGGQQESDASGAPPRDMERHENMGVQYASADYDPILKPGMILVIESVNPTTRKVSRAPIPIISSEVVTVRVPLMIVGKKLSLAQEAVRDVLGPDVNVGLTSQSGNTVRIFGKVARPGLYPHGLSLSTLLAAAGDRSVGSNFKIHFVNGATNQGRTITYEDVVKGVDDPYVFPESHIYLPSTAGSLFGEMFKEQGNVWYILLTTLATGLSIIAVTK